MISGDVIGLERISLPITTDAKLIVYPGKINMEDAFIPASYLQGDTIVRRWIVDDPFIVSGTRQYLPGDPMNRINWKAIKIWANND